MAARLALLFGMEPDVAETAGARRPAMPATLKRRKDFLACARARKAFTNGMIVQGRAREPGEADGTRVGYTCSKKVGNAVVRNRAKRRLREAARAVLAERGRPDWDYVLIGKHGATAERRFEALKRDLADALDRVHGARAAP